MNSIQSYIAPGRRAHLIGIGGVSMAPLAEVLAGAGMRISGSDLRESPTVLHLRSLGILIALGHAAEHIPADAELVIRTAAAHNENPEVAEAHRRGLPLFERAQAWGAIMSAYQHALCISGTHGKTTTTSMATHIIIAAGRDPTVMIGGTLPLLGAGHRVGMGDTIILESCEYCNSFLSFFPTVAVILNIEADHLDFFKDLPDVQRSFRAFADLVPVSGCIVANGDDENTMTALAGETRTVRTFGLTQGNVHTESLTWTCGLPDFDLVIDGRVFAHVALSVPGLHNVKNALAAATAAHVLGISAQAVEEGLAQFQGAGRRFERKGTYRGADIYDDYAHHPGELSALFQAVGTLGYQRIICAFQPHTYTRTAALLDNFAEVLQQPDVTILSEIYAAREVNESGISSRDLQAKIPDSLYCATLEETTSLLRAMAQPGDLILTVGAGDIYTVGEKLMG